MIETPRLRLVPCGLEHFEAILTDRGRLGEMLGAAVPEDAFDFPGVSNIETVRLLYERLKADPDMLGWWTYLFVHKGDGVLIGQGGYKGGADEMGAVEIGYAIVLAYRERGLATEAARGLIDHAFGHDHVKRVEAHTLAERNASASVLQRVGMRFVGAVADRDLGEIWRWSLPKANHRPGPPPNQP